MSNTTEQTVLTAPDISCDHCVATINRAVGGLDGVSRVEADAATKQVRVEYDPERVSLAEIETVMAEEGYPVQE